MGRFSIETERTTSVPPAAARAWMFDLQPEDHDHPRFQELWKPKPGDGRTIASRTATQVTTADIFGGQPMSFTDTLVGDDRMSVEGTGKGYKSKGLMTFAPHGDGSKISFSLDSETSGLFALFMLFMGGKFKEELKQDFAIHCDIMEEEWAKKQW